MPSFFENCENFFGTNDLYQLLQIKKTASQDEVKKAYKRLSLVVHPDRVSDESKEHATEKFKILGKVYSIISDNEKRAIYDETGHVDDEDGNFKVDSWMDYWKTLFQEVTNERLDEYEKRYKGSQEEVEDLIKAYKIGKGDINYIYEYVPFAFPEDEERMSKIIQDLIDRNVLKPYKAFTDESPSKKAVRKRKWEKERRAFDKEQKKIKKAGGNGPKVDLVAAIKQRNRDRESTMDNFLHQLENKYGKPKAGKKHK